jgi:hypothetical protein
MAKMTPAQFEKSPVDVEKPGVPEGSPQDMAMDKRQLAAHNAAGPTHSAKKPNPPFTPFGKHPGAKPA